MHDYKTKSVLYIHTDRWPLKEASSVQGWEVFRRLNKSYKTYVLPSCPFPHSTKLDYSNLFGVDLFFIIIDGHFRIKTEFFSFLGRYLLNKKIIWLINAPTSESHFFRKRNVIRQILEHKTRRFFAKSVHLAICVSDELASYAQTQLSIENCIVIPNGANHRIFKPSKHHNTTKTFSICWAGNGRNPWQGIDILFRVAEQMLLIDRTVSFTIYSDRLWVTKQPPKNIKIIKAIEYLKLPQKLNRAEIFLCLYNVPPKEFYFSPQKLFDYMAMGKPIIATDIGQISKVINDFQNGVLTNNTVNDIIDKILFLKSNPRLRQKIGKEARRTIAKHYSWDNTWEKIKVTIGTAIQQP